MKIIWNLPSCLIVLFYLSMILAELLSTRIKRIDSLEDLADAEDMAVVTEKFTSNMIQLTVRLDVRSSVGSIIILIMYCLLNLTVRYKSTDDSHS